MGDRDWFLSIENLLHNWTDIVKDIGYVLTIGLGIVGLLEYLILTYFILAFYIWIKIILTVINNLCYG